MTLIASHSSQKAQSINSSIYSQKVKARARFSDHNIPIYKDFFLKKATDVLNTFYRKKLPLFADISVRKLDGKNVLWKCLSLPERQDILNNHHRGGTAALDLPYEGPSYLKSYIPRWTHGLMHASRVGLLIRITANMYRKYGGIEISEKEVLLAQYLSLFHDSARQAEGVDVWDDESAENAYPFLIQEKFEPDVALECVQILKEKDSNSFDKHILSKLIQSADCLDIMRIYGFYGFENDYLDMYQDLKNTSGFKEEFEGFKKEYANFIENTEKPLFKAYLEKNSENYFEEIQALALMKKYDSFRHPLFSKWYDEKGSSLKKMTEMIFDLSQNDKWGEYTKVQEIYEGTHPCLILINKKGDLFFFKEISEKEAKIEEVASIISSELTNGLVPIAKTVEIESKKGILEPYFDLDKSIFKGLYGFEAKKLSFDQKKQLLIHMIADYVIRNYDAHTGQFGVDRKGNIIGLDKGEAFRPTRSKSSFFKNEPAHLDPNFYWPPLGNDEPTYLLFAKHLQEKEIGQDLLEELSVKEAFKNCKKLAKSDKFSKMIMSITGKFNVLQEYCQRAENAEKEFRNYFIEKDAGSIKYCVH